ncbi:MULTISPECIES: Asp-tRNA(Asn)/Glu-tRNA(Gln) amidotransferase subunit GatC [Moraxella]|uniref:Aspartyl/glutamyl-tRNA(Asn/Gln) amidotransferase subunit C n=1 Tax=Moraxella nasicaprae TaxID=2904122 RepID=A0ABY6F607_9GAMM|nr:MULTISPECIES: Asp-tRNA(Asn)/Glu-tRNA(Gln) amidotransferase subunit GatC [Moraxella]MDO4893922.1 Asp-tRNA(Asn)/Glu-tRNA(Gln) amidotransferase subunit GatC [Moraxella sp.]UXZ05532.1 Asp-tRNA(Asn)/Glu-tRNA(Gln) amidotransferase subunit GatC [Moraxella nasicaprae]
MSATLSCEDILAVAKLSRLSMDEKLAGDYAKDISKILSMMDILNGVNTDGVEPLANIHASCQTLRQDIPTNNIDRTANQSVAPSVQDGLYLVPQVIE